jgi:hypothetical protein
MYVWARLMGVGRAKCMQLMVYLVCYRRQWWSGGGFPSAGIGLFEQDKKGLLEIVGPVRHLTGHRGVDSCPPCVHFW